MRLFSQTGERRLSLGGATRLWIVLVLLAAVGVTITATASLTSPAHLVLVRLVGLAVLALAALAAQAAMAAAAGHVAIDRADRPAGLPEDVGMAETVRLLRLHVRTLEATLEATSADFGTLRGVLVTERDEARADELQRVAVVVRAMPRSTGPLTDTMSVGGLARVEAAISRLSSSWSFERPPLAEAVPSSRPAKSHLPRAESGPVVEPSERGAAPLAPDPAPPPAVVDNTILPVPAPLVAPTHGRRWHRRRSVA